MVDEDYFGAGAAAELDKRLEGDAFLAGGRATVRAPVKGDVALAGGDVTVMDTVGQDLYASGGSVAVSGQVAGNARIAGGQVTITHRGGVAGKAIVAANRLQLSGRVGRYLVVYGESVRIDGEVGGDLRITARSIEIGPEAKIGGKLIYRSPDVANIDSRAVIAGGVTRSELNWPRQQTRSLLRAAAWISLGLVLLSLLVVGAAMIAAFPRFSAQAAGTVRSDPWTSLAVGFALLLCIPVAAILFLITVIGVPLGLVLLFLYPAMLLLGYLTAALFLGDLAVSWLADHRGVPLRPAWRFLALALALMILLLVAKIPYAGPVILFLALLLGLGAFWVQAYRRYAHKHAPAQAVEVA